ncbi:serine/threonine-protein kinase [Mycolicibacterium mucogenicum]|uniref:serine/threonine-protein kinase n=1 Tax=Mycolicibacterium mucogenicum TaxID=56689 RepID=UPI0023AA4189|nr:serine/threonine-protein kinase [Mycolicibacterium mucogenicum]
MLLTEGQVFAGYTIRRKLGAGGMGSVYLASHPRLPRLDAVKVLSADLTSDPEYGPRFLREADLVSTLSHPNILGVHDRGECDGQLWISMDYVAGTDAAQLLREHYPAGMPPEVALPIIQAVASALDHAHRRGLLHRDVKPANILLDAETSRIYLADFGIARPMNDSAGLTATNMAVGTVAYAAPEQLRGEGMDGRTDQYALACTAFQLLTGNPPYADSNPAVVITKHVTAPAPSLGSTAPNFAAWIRSWPVPCQSRPRPVSPAAGSSRTPLSSSRGSRYRWCPTIFAISRPWPRRCRHRPRGTPRRFRTRRKRSPRHRRGRHAPVCSSRSWR